jgi:uncharacterized protein (TIGR00299 family) protein
MRIGYLECFSGISGDMLLGALVDAGVPFDLLEKTAAALNVGAHLESHKVMRGGLAATKVDVVVQGSGIRDQGSESAHIHEHEHSHPHDHEPDSQSHEHPHEHANAEHSHSEPHAHKHAPAHAAHRPLSAILGIIAAAPLNDAVKARAGRAFQLLGEAEAAIHSVPVEQVHFHEVGAVDTIVDIVCAAAGCEALGQKMGIARWLSSPLNVGSGTVKCRHGTLPVPAPATLALLGDAPIYSAGPPMERVTPTGAAILRMLDVTYGSLPAMRVEASGYGAGGRDTPGEPNLLRLLVGEEAAGRTGAQAHGQPAPTDAEPIAVIEAVIDDSTPELLAYVSELLLEAGAWDVYRAAVQMKKGRSGVQMTVLSSPERMPALRDLLLRETTTIGLRWRMENKMALNREFAEAKTPWGVVRIKIARWPDGRIANAAPEYEDCRTLAREHAVPLKQVMQAATRACADLEQKEEGRR